MRPHAHHEDEGVAHMTVDRYVPTGARASKQESQDRLRAYR
jgi:hypothetical protein